MWVNSSAARGTILIWLTLEDWNMVFAPAVLLGLLVGLCGIPAMLGSGSALVFNNLIRGNEVHAKGTVERNKINEITCDKP